MDYIVLFILCILCVYLCFCFSKERKQVNLYYELLIKALKKYLDEDDNE